MVRTPLRVVLATWTLVALIVTSVGPVVNAALGEPSGQRDDHACCPETIGPDGQASRSSDGSLPCCAIGNASPQVPAGTPTVVRSSAPPAAPVLAPSWSQTLAPLLDARPCTGVTLGPIPIVLRTSVLLI
jgi:hypothetical protein